MNRRGFIAGLLASVAGPAISAHLGVPMQVTSFAPRYSITRDVKGYLWWLGDDAIWWSDGRDVKWLE